MTAGRAGDGRLCTAAFPESVNPASPGGGQGVVPLRHGRLRLLLPGLWLSPDRIAADQPGDSGRSGGWPIRSQRGGHPRALHFEVAWGA